MLLEQSVTTAQPGVARAGGFTCASITFDDSLWPLLVVRFKGGASDKQYAEMLLRASTYVGRGARYVIISDVSEAGIPSAAQRQMLVEWLRKHDTQLREQVLGSATIVTSAFIRLSLSLVFHSKPLPMPNIVVPDMDSALKFVLGKLEEDGCSSEVERIRHHCGLPGVHAG